MSSDDYWRKKQEEDRRREALHKGVRERDYDAAVRAASPDAYLEYLRLKGSGGAPPASASGQQVAALVEEQQSLAELVECTGLDIHGRVRLIQMVYAVDLSSSDAREKLDQARRYIEGYM